MYVNSIVNLLGKLLFAGVIIGAILFTLQWI